MKTRYFLTKDIGAIPKGTEGFLDECGCLYFDHGEALYYYAILDAPAGGCDHIEIINPPEHTDHDIQRAIEYTIKALNIKNADAEILAKNFIKAKGGDKKGDK